MKDLSESLKKSYDIAFVLALLLVLAAVGLATGFDAECFRILSLCVYEGDCRQGLYVLFLLSLALLYITYRRWRRAEKARSELEEIISSINPDVLMVVLPDSTIRDCTQQVARMFGRGREDVIGRKTWLLYADRRSSPDKRNEIFEILERNGFHIGEATGIRANGSRFPLEIITGSLSNRPGSVVLLRDITERKRVEEEKAKMESRLRQGHKMEALGVLAAGIAHDFNGILAVVRLAVDLVRMKTRETEALRSTLTHIEEAVDRGASLVKQIRTFSGHGTPDAISLHVSRIAREAMEFIRLSLPATIQVRLHLEVESDRVMGSSEEIYRVFVNLCTNAAYAMRTRGGILDVRLEKATLEQGEAFVQGELGPGSYVRIVVSDTGHGIRKEILEQIFDPFFSTKPSEEGSGMGLSIVYGIVKKMGGGVRVVSEEGKGATFEILLPCVEDSQPASAQDPSPRAG